VTTALFLVALMAPAKPAYLAYDGLVIGYRVGSTWHKADKLPTKSMPIALKHIGVGTIGGSVAAKGLINSTDGPEGVDLDGDDDAMKGVLFSGAASVPRPVRVLSNQNDTYLKVMGTLLRAHGVNSKPRLTRVIAADLDGDGTTEVILEASSRDDLLKDGMRAARKNDYSIVLLRYIRGGKVVEAPLLFDHPKEGRMPFVDKVVAVADFDGHGTMEFMVASDYYEGVSSRLYRYKRGTVTKLVENGTGA
jgi:hypothetical protein